MYCSTENLPTRLPALPRLATQSTRPPTPARNRVLARVMAPARAVRKFMMSAGGRDGALLGPEACKEGSGISCHGPPVARACVLQIQSNAWRSALGKEKETLSSSILQGCMLLHLGSWCRRLGGRSRRRSCSPGSLLGSPWAQGRGLCRRHSCSLLGCRPGRRRGRPDRSSGRCFLWCSHAAVTLTGSACCDMEQLTERRTASLRALGLSGPRCVRCTGLLRAAVCI